MLTVFHTELGVIRQTVISDDVRTISKNAIWIDLFNPTKDEERLVEIQLDLELPTRADMQEIEDSSRFYVDGSALVMTLPILVRSHTTAHETDSVTFILSSGRLITMRYADPTPFSYFITRLKREPSLSASGEFILLGLLDQISSRLADILEAGTADLEKVSHSIFDSNSDSSDKVDFNQALKSIGSVGDLSSKAKDSLLSFMRLLTFLSVNLKGKKAIESRITTLNNDALSIDQHAKFLSGKAQFLLDATLGLINIEQNYVIKIFSVVAAVFLPPTLISSIYGMNFKNMPELEWEAGYPIALGLILVAAILPLWYFKKKKWL